MQTCPQAGRWAITDIPGAVTLHFYPRAVPGTQNPRKYLFIEPTPPSPKPHEMQSHLLDFLIMVFPEPGPDPHIYLARTSYWGCVCGCDGTRQGIICKTSWERGGCPRHTEHEYWPHQPALWLLSKTGDNSAGPMCTWMQKSGGRGWEEPTLRITLSPRTGKNMDFLELRLIWAKLSNNMLFLSIMLVKKWKNLFQNLSAIPFWSAILGAGVRGDCQTMHPKWNGNKLYLQVALGFFSFLKQRLRDQ